MKHLFIKNIPTELAIKIKVAAALRTMKISDLVIAAITTYLDSEYLQGHEGGGRK